MNEKISGLLDPKMWEMSEEAKALARQQVRDFYKKHPSGMLTYEDAEPVKVHAPRVEMMPARRQGFFGRIMDRILRSVKKPQGVLILDKEQQEHIKELLKEHKDGISACAITADEVRDASDRMVVLARGHHIRNDDGTVTDVSDDPKYECQE